MLVSLSVRSVVTLFCVALIVVTAAVTLGVTYSFSLSAAQSIAHDHAVALAQKAKGDVEAFINQPVGLVAGLQYMLQRDSFPLPGVIEPSTPTWYRWWWQILISAMRSANFAYQFAIFGFNDGNYAGCKLLSDVVFECRVFLYSARANPSNNGKSAIFQEDYYISNYSLIRNGTGLTTYDPRTRSWWTATPHQVNSMTWSAVYLSAMPTLPIVDINAAIFNASGTFLGVGSFTFELGELSSFVTNLKTTPNTNIFLIDNDNSLMASTYRAVPYLNETPVPPTFPASQVPSGCVMSDVANGAAKSVLLCRFNVTSYPYAPLQLLYAQAPSLVLGGTKNDEAVLMDLGGDSYFVSVVRISTPLASGMGWRVVLLMPQLDIIYGIIAGRNTAIYIAIGLLVGASLFALLIVSVLLAPLQLLAERMYRAASFEEDTVDDEALPHDESLFTELQTIQEAFETLTGELAKVKSYLPQSVLAALYGDACSEDDEEEEDDDGEVISKKPIVSEGANDKDVDKRKGTTSADVSRAPSISVTNNNHRTSNSYLQQRNGGGGSFSVAGSMRRGGSIASSMIGGGGHGGGAAAPPVALNTMLKLSSRKVTVLSINICNFHATAKHTSPDELLRMHGSLVDLVARIAKDNKGVLDAFSGDRFLITFNAVTSVGNHACAASAAALAIAKAVQHGSSSSDDKKINSSAPSCCWPGGASCGIASGQAMVGNMGNQAVKRFCVIGPCVGHALLMERLCKRYHQRVRVLMCGQAITDTENFYELMFVDVVRLAGMLPSETKRQRVAVVAGPKSVSCDEWMYQLEEGSNSSCYGLHNECFTKILMEGSVTQEKAKAMLNKAAERARTDAEDEMLFEVSRDELQRMLSLVVVVDSDSNNTSAANKDYFNTLPDLYPTCHSG